MLRLLLYTSGLLLLSIPFSGCAEDVFGCTDPQSITYNPEATVNDGSCATLSDQLPGIWAAETFFIDGTDAIGLNIIQSFRIQFNEDNTFSYAIVLASGAVGGAAGTWTEVDEATLQLTFTAANSFTFCGDSRHRFRVGEPLSPTTLALTDNCENGTPLALDLVKE